MSYIPRGNNLIINGDMALDQRGSAAAPVTMGASTYFVDRFQALETFTTGAGTATQVAVAAGTAPYVYGFQYAAKITATTGFASPGAAEQAHIIHRVEGYDFKQVAQKNATLSFWVRLNHATTADFPITAAVSFRSSTADRSLVSQYVITSNNTWQEISIPVNFATGTASGTWVYTNGIGVFIGWTTGAGTNLDNATNNTWATANYIATAASGAVNLLSSTNDTLEITGVRLNEGTQKVPFVRAGGGTYAAELALAQRYYEKQSSLLYYTASGAAGAAVFFKQDFRVTKRTTPTIVLTEGSLINVTGSASTSTGIADAFNILATATSANTRTFIGSSNDAAWTADAEL